MKLELQLAGLGNVPSFKNSRLIARGRLITKPEYRKWMDRATRSFEFQLSSASLTIADATRTAPSPPSSIAWWTRFDDSRQWIREIHVQVEIVPKGAEGAILLLESL